jgi:hypothetical protein
MTTDLDVVLRDLDDLEPTAIEPHVPRPTPAKRPVRASLDAIVAYLRNPY